MMKHTQSNKVSLLVLAAMLLVTFGALADSVEFQNIERDPDSVIVITETGTNQLAETAKGNWSNNGVRVKFVIRGSKLDIKLSAPGLAVKTLQVNWNARLSPDWSYLGDAWERAYGDLEWRSLDSQRIMPWYFLASNGHVTHGYGVATGPAALCYWQVSESTLELYADVRCGGQGVQLGKRTLNVCTVVSRSGQPGESSFAAAQAFCRIMCPQPRLPRQPVYGFNDWYCAYGHDTADKFLADVAYLVSLNPGSANRPFAVVDDGWQWKGADGKSPGLWNQTNPAFSPTLSMADFAAKIVAAGARPGLWYRPLVANAGQPQSWRLQRDPDYLDPTVPAVRQMIRQTMRRFHAWGFRLIKNDFTTFDICGRWGMQMGGEVTPDGWAFADRSRTTAEIVRDLYRDLREGAGDDTLVLGCNTIGHLAAGIFEMQRIGDDVSSKDWKRTRKMGVNCLAFRAAQDGAFFAVDADCVGQVSRDSIPWDKNSQWLYLLAHSGTTLFVSFPPETVSPDQETALREALTVASRRQPLGEPLDWSVHRTPERWLLDNQEHDFAW